MGNHFKRWGAVYILSILWLTSSLLQYVFMLPEIKAEGIAVFWAATFENWQSEFLQLVAQAILIVGLAKYIFTKGEEDKEELKTEIAELKNGIQR